MAKWSWLMMCEEEAAALKKSVTVRLEPELLTAAKCCAAREHRSLTNFIEASLLARIGDSAAKAVVKPPCATQTPERLNRGE